MRKYDIPMENGTVKGTLNIGAQADLAAKNHDLWEEWNKIYSGFQSNKEMSEITIGKALYIAYVCANLDNPMPEGDFLHSLSDDREALSTAIQQMFGIGKKTGFQPPLNRPQKKKTRR